MPAGRPRGFDIDEAEDVAMQLFWDRGYEGVSLADLRNAMGISSASFYAAFGSKAELFERVVRRYAASTNHIMRIVADTSLPPREALALVLHEAVDAQTRTDNPKGCLIALNGALASSSMPESARATLRARRDADRLKIRAFLEAALAHTSASGSVDIDGWTTTVHGFILGVATQARDGIAPSELHRAAEVLAGAWEAALCKSPDR